MERRLKDRLKSLRKQGNPNSSAETKLQEYNNKSKFLESELKRYDKWLANWCKSNPKTPSHGMWQFGGSTNELRSTKIAGMTVDQDYAYKDYPKLIKKQYLNGFTKKENTNKNILICSHSWVGRLLFYFVSDEIDEQVIKIAPKHASIYEIKI